MWRQKKLAIVFCIHLFHPIPIDFPTSIREKKATRAHPSYQFRCPMTATAAKQSVDDASP
jgi:hypothetical protein